MEREKTKKCAGAIINGVRICEREKPVSEFYYHPRAKDRLSYYCKSCLNARQREYYKTRMGQRVRRMAYVRRRLKELEKRLPILTKEIGVLKTELEQLKNMDRGDDGTSTEPVRT